MPAAYIITSPVESPLYVKIQSICSASNNAVPAWSTTPGFTWGHQYPCNLNAGTIVSTGILFSLVATLAGLVVFHLMSRWPAGDDSTSWGQRMNKLKLLTKRGCTSLFLSMAQWIAGLAAFIFLIFIVVYSSRARSDSTDGIRMGAGYLVAVVASLASCFIAFAAGSAAFTPTARSAMSGSGVSASLRTAFSAGCASSFSAQGIILFFMWAYYLFMTLVRDRDAYYQYGNRCDTAGEFCGQTLGWRETTGYVLGVSTVAIVVRLMAGIYAKAAEIGSELMFKLEGEAASDSMANPAAVADKVGAVAVDGVAFMIEMVESVAIIVISCELLAAGIAPRLAIPVWCTTASVLSALLATLFVRCSSATYTTVTQRYTSMMWGLRLGMYGNMIFTFFTNAIIMGILYSKYPDDFGGEREGWKYFACLLIGMIASGFVWEFTSYFTTSAHPPTRSVGAAGITGPSTLLIQGVGVGFISSLPIAFTLSGVIIAAGAIGGQYGVGLAALGFANNCWFAIAASTIAHAASNADATCDSYEMAQVRETTVALHMAGESCAAETRGYSIGLSVMACFSCLAAYRQEVGLVTAEADVVSEAILFACGMCGAFMPILISGITTLSIGKATRALVDETRRQLQFIAGAGYTECNPESISQATSLPSGFGAMLPVLMAIFLPSSFGFLLGARCLMLYCAGGVFSALAVSLAISNAGATWVKSKTVIEALGAFGGSGSDAHAAALVGARTGAAFKDVTAPTMVSVAKMQCLVALVIAPLIFVDVRVAYMAQCFTDLINSGRSPLACIDWNKAYWAPLPIVFLVVAAIVFYVIFWNRDGTPPQKEESPMVPMASASRGAHMGMVSPPAPQPQQQMRSQEQVYQPMPIQNARMSPSPPAMMRGGMPNYAGNAPPPLFASQGQSGYSQAQNFQPQYKEPFTAAPMRPPQAQTVNGFKQSGYVVAGM